MPNRKHSIFQWFTGFYKVEWNIVDHGFGLNGVLCPFIFLLLFLVCFQSMHMHYTVHTTIIFYCKFTYILLKPENFISQRCILFYRYFRLRIRVFTGLSIEIRNTMPTK